MLTSIYQIVAHYGPQAAYNYWAVLGLDIFNLVMWLTAFALLASEVAPFLSAGSTTCNYLGRCTKTSLAGDALTLAATQMTAAALGGVELYVYLAPAGIPTPFYSQLTLPLQHPVHHHPRHPLDPPPPPSRRRPPLHAPLRQPGSRLPTHNRQAR